MKEQRLNDRVRRVCLIFLVIGGSLFAHAQDRSPMMLAIDGNRVTASRVPPGATVVFYSVALVGDGYSTTTKWLAARAIDQNHDGVVTYDYSGYLPFRSVWVVVNEADGDYAIASPTGYFRKNGSALGFRKHGPSVDEVDWPGRVTYLLYVHAESGAWSGFSVDGSDEDGKADYMTSLALSKLRPVQPDNTRKPAALKPGGTLILINGEDLRTSVVKLDGATLNGAK